VSENPTVVKNLTQYTSQNGVDASRLIFTPRVHPAQFRSYLKCADVFLDTAPYGNGATAREAILANLPILTLPGNTMMSRLSGHLMKRLGMDDFVVDSRSAYENFAVTLGQSPALMAEYKDKMMASRATSELFDTDLFVKQFGQALLKASQLT
jgi:predicted O-linked N-acetylglucosamine transferase (SPINDLY family)